MEPANLKQASHSVTGNGAEALRPASGTFASAGGHADGVSADAFVDLEKIRDILFGAERRESERKLSDLEGRVEAQAVKADLELQRHMEAFEDQIKAELRTIANEISESQRKSADTLELMARELRSSMSSLEQQVQTLSSKVSTSEQELRQEIGVQVANASSALRASVDELDTNVDRKVQELRANSVDWSGLSVTLRDLASQVAMRRPGRDESPSRTD